MPLCGLICWYHTQDNNFATGHSVWHVRLHGTVCHQLDSRTVSTVANIQLPAQDIFIRQTQTLVSDLSDVSFTVILIFFVRGQISAMVPSIGMKFCTTVHMVLDVFSPLWVSLGVVFPWDSQDPKFWPCEKRISRKY